MGERSTLMSEFGDTNMGQFSAPNAPSDISALKDCANLISSQRG